MIDPRHAPTLGAQYFPYIDGLRALAVLAVVVYHLHGPWLPGGFVGVDVFFVISGFVVSASLAGFKGRGLGRFLAYFYARRIRRIVPALVLCLLVTAYVSALLVPSSWLSAVNQQTGLYAFFGLSNFILASTGRDYFAPTTEYNPYTHTWSLAVEEQFYLVFPLLFIAWVMGQRGRGLSFVLFFGGMLVSAGFAAWQSQASPTEAYFLTPGRFWELAMGVLLYQYLASGAPGPRPTGDRHRVLGWLALLTLLGAFVFSRAAHFPFPGALPAVLGTLGLIYCLHERQGLARLHALLGTPVLVAVGKISYSLYLWHWPVFVLFRWTLGLDSIATRTLALILAFVLAIASYRLVENPLRYAGWLRRVPQPAVITGGLLLVGGGWSGAAYIADNLHAVSLSVLSRQQDIWYPHGPSVLPDYPGCNADPEYHDVQGGLLLVYRVKGCQVPRPEAERRLFVIGDSHALAYEGLFKQYAIRTATTIHAYNNGGCPFISLQPYRDIDNAPCRGHAEAALADLRQRIRPGDVLFLPSLRLARFSDQWAYFGEAQARQQMFSDQARSDRARAVADAIEVLRPFVAQGVQVVFEAPKPLFKAPPFRCADTFNRHNPICRQGFSMPRALLEEFRAPVLHAFGRIAQTLPGVTVWDPFPVLCPGPECQAWDEQGPLFLDGDHLSGHGNGVLLHAFGAHLKALPRQ